jgi:hypothetical protein
MNIKVNGGELGSFTFTRDEGVIDLSNSSSSYPSPRGVITLSFDGCEYHQPINIGDVLSFNGVEFELTEIGKNSIKGFINEHTNKKD